MNKKTLTSVLVGLGIVALFIFVYLFLYKGDVGAPTSDQIDKSIESTTSTSPNFTGNEDAFKNALNLYIQKKQEGIDMGAGPCLGKVADDWVLDIAHNPRLPVDDEPENQCADFREGKVKHFIELDPDGKLIQSH